MRPLIIALFCFLTTSFLGLDSAHAQHHKDGAGKSYYDEEKTKLKEVYSYKEVMSFDPNNIDGGMQKKVKKHGAYFYYFENGKPKISGNYKNDQKDGTWKYYDIKGTLIKEEVYKDGKLIESKEENP